MKLVLSGFAGVGKSTVIDKAKLLYPQLFIATESAREVNHTMDFFKINDINSEFFQKSVMDNEIMKIMLSHINKIENVLYDRCIIDNFAFAEIYYGANRVDYSKFQDFVFEFCETHKIESIYDSILYIKSTVNVEHINKYILCDPFRRQTTAQNAIDFIDRSKRWEEIYLNIFNKIKGVSPKINYINHFSENKKYDLEIDNYLKNHFS
jgi:hypothetical protein